MNEVDKDVAIERDRALKLFGECTNGHGLLDCGFCPECQPVEHARSRALADEEAKRRDEKRRAEEAERNKPNSEMATLLETRRDAMQYVTLCRALRGGYATDLQIRLARRLTTKRALKRAERKSA